MRDDDMDMRGSVYDGEYNEGYIGSNSVENNR
jgi:hypothetical protein